MVGEGGKKIMKKGEGRKERTEKEGIKESEMKKEERRKEEEEEEDRKNGKRTGREGETN